jgi:hypothetical protein
MQYLFTEFSVRIRSDEFAQLRARSTLARTRRKSTSTTPLPRNRRPATLQSRSFMLPSHQERDVARSTSRRLIGTGSVRTTATAGSMSDGNIGLS